MPIAAWRATISRRSAFRARTKCCALYCRRTGRTALPDWDFYIAFNMFRLAAILHGIMGRVIEGTAASARAAEAGARAKAIAEAGWQQVEAIKS